MVRTRMAGFGRGVSPSRYGWATFTMALTRKRTVLVRWGGAHLFRETVLGKRSPPGLLGSGLSGASTTQGWEWVRGAWMFIMCWTDGEGSFTLETAGHEAPKKWVR